MPKKNQPVEYKFSSSLGGVTVPDPVKFAAGDSGDVLVYLPFLPLSPFNTKDARSGITFLYDVATLNATSFQTAEYLPLDIEHNTETGVVGADTRARGRWNRIVLAADAPEAGLKEDWSYAPTLLNNLGQEAVKNHHYLSTSAVLRGVWLDENTIQFTEAVSNTLTNTPANRMPNNPDLPTLLTAMTASRSAALHEKTNDLNRMDLAQMGLPADADEAAVTAELKALANGKTAAADAAAQFTNVKTDAETVRTQLTASQAELTTVKAELSAFKAADTERVQLSAVDAVIAAGKATPAQRDGLIANVKAAGVEAFNKLFENASPVVGVTQDFTKHASGEDKTFGLTPDQIETATKAGVSLQTFAAQLEQSRKALGL